MISRRDYEAARRATLDLLQRTGIVLTSAEKERIEVADCGLGDLKMIGLQAITYVNTERVCAKELVMTPHQSFPEHKHPAVAGQPGKEETFRCRAGQVYLYVPGEPARNPHARPPKGFEQYHTVYHEIELNPGEQYTLHPDTPHWFQAGPEGCVVSEFSTRSTDENDIFTDPNVRRIPEIEPA